MAADEQEIAEILRRLSNRSQTTTDRQDCPDEESLALFLAGNLPESRRSEVEAHLARCAFCLDDVVAAYQSGELTAGENVPRRLMARAMALIPGREAILDLAVRLVKDSIELVSTSARLVTAPSPVVRGEPAPEVGNSLQVEQAVGRFRVAVELDLSDAGLCQVIANVTEESGTPAEGVRLSLSSGEREQASFLTRAGVVVFDRISPGEYSIAVSESGSVVGRIRLNLMLER